MSKRATFTSPLRKARERTTFSREKVAPLLEPPVTAKTIERWERGETRAPRWRLEQLAELYGVSLRSISQRRQVPEIEQRYKVYLAVANALNRGELVRPDRCSSCGAQERAEAHHEDYTKALEVEWLCHTCHRTRHTNGKAATTPSRVNGDGLPTQEVTA